MKPIYELSDEMLSCFLTENHEEFLNLYNNYMFREINIYEFAGRVGTDVQTLQKMIELFTK